MSRTIIGFFTLYAMAWLCAAPFRDWPVLLFAAVWALPLIWASVVDFLTMKIPDLAVGAIAGCALAFRLMTDLPVLAPVLAALGIAAAFWLLGEVYFRMRGRDGLGIGDAKLLGAVTLATGPGTVWLVVLLAALGGIGYVFATLRAGARASEPVPFGPFLAYAAFLVQLVVIQS